MPKFQKFHFCIPPLAGALLGFLLLSLLVPAYIAGQAIVSLRVESGFSATSCSDVFSNPDPQWSVDVNGNGWVTYPASGGCYQNVPNTQYQAVFNCIEDLPATIELCFRAFEDDGFFCNPITSCNESVCQNYSIPMPGQTATHTLSLPTGGASEGQVTFVLETEGAFAVNDLICDAIDLGVLPAGGALGDILMSNYTNECATNLNEPSPSSTGSWTNDQGVWFSFTTSANPGAVIPILASNDPEGLGNNLHTQIAVYVSDDGTCTGNLTLVKESFTTADFNTKLLMPCLEPSTTYFVLVDGTGLYEADALSGYFGLAIFDGQSIAGGDTRCDSENLGIVPEGGQLLVLNNTNICATNAGDPPIVAGLFGVARGVWYEFKPPSSGNIIVEVTSGQPVPLGFGAIDLEIALYHTINDLCDGFRILDTASYNKDSFDESFEISCLDPDRPYWLLVDGSAMDDSGVFDISITDGGNHPPSTTIDTTICAGESVVIDGVVYNQSGAYAQAFPLDNGCDSTVFLNLIVQEELLATGVEVSPATSIVNPNGIATVTINGGGAPFSYFWSNGLNTDTIYNLPAGTYCVLVTDTLGCTDTACVTIALELEPIDAMLPPDSLSCFGDTDGELLLTATGGDAPYAVFWENTGTGASGSGTLAFEGGVLAISNLSGGTYIVTLTDLNGTTTEVNAQVFEPTPLSLDIINISEPSCFGFCDGSAEANASGGTTPYGFNWSTGQFLPELTGACAGNYSLELTDNNGCTVSSSVFLADPPEFIAQGTPLKPVTCFGDNNGSAVVNTNGMPINYFWDNGEIAQEAVLLTAGVHEVVVQNVDGCFDTTEVIIEGPASPLSVAIEEISPISCWDDTDGSLEVEATGGAGGYEILWSNGVNQLEIEDLSPGQYEVVITDAYGCEESASYILEAPLPIEAEIDITDATCAGNKLDGIVEVTGVSGGEAPFTYRMLSPVFGDTAVFSGLKPGDYTLYVRDARGCIAEFSADIFPPEEVLLQVIDDVTIQAGETLVLETFVFPEGNLQFRWSPPEALSCADCPEPIASPLESTIYALEILDTVSLCRATGRIAVSVFWERDVFIPNIFSPDGDGRNDRFFIFGGPQVSQVKSLVIYSRWGELVFESLNAVPGDHEEGWDGTYKGNKVSPGVYIYKVAIEFIDGTIEYFGGDITIPR